MRAITTSYLLLSLLLAPACSGGGGSSSGRDGGDLAGPDASDTLGAPDANTSSAVQCASTRIVERYPWGITSGGYYSQYDLVLGIQANSLDAPSATLTLEVIGAATGVPTTVSFTPESTYNTCEVCMLMSEGCVGNDCKTHFFPLGGSVAISQADRNESVGAVRASSSGLLFAEWDLSTNTPVDGGRCIELQSFDFDYAWGSSGSCSGDACGPGGDCCSDSPYCSLGNNNIGRFCSDFCGASGDGCTGNDDCCDGFECFLGTCVTDSCSSDSCTTGLDEGGGCCAQAPYCNPGFGCVASCGDSGQACGGDLDCCTGLACTAGSCS